MRSNFSPICINQKFTEGLNGTYDDSVLNFHRRVLEGYHPTEQIKISPNASFQGELFAKLETDRFGLPAFKVLGASYACFQDLCRHWHLNARSTTLAELRKLASINNSPTFICTTDGNHGRAVAWFARKVGLQSRIFLPATVAQGPIDHIRREGAEVEQLNMSYDEAVNYAAQYHATTSEDTLLIQDTAWVGYEQVPRLIVKGYSTISYELSALNPSHVIVPVGVGSLAQAIVDYPPTKDAKIISVEPETAACLWTSLNSGSNISVVTEYTRMFGLNCGAVSSIAWPSLEKHVAAAVRISDEQAIQASRKLASQGINAGPCGAATLAAFEVLLSDHTASAFLGLNQVGSRVALIITEGSEASTI